MLVPKSEELVAIPYRFEGDKRKAQHFFEDGLNRAFARIRQIQDSHYPLTVYYAFKQSETESEDDKESSNRGLIASTGWETMLQGLINAGFTITGTWPMRTELIGNLKQQGSRVRWHAPGCTHSTAIDQSRP